MNKSLINDAAKWGVLLGVILGCSKIFEQSLMLSGESSKMGVLALEWIVVAVVYGALTFKALKMRASQSDVFKYGQGVNYSILISLFASIIVAFSSYIYIDSYVGGYEQYASQLVDSMSGVIAEIELGEETKALYTENFEALQEASANSSLSLIDVLLNTCSIYIITGALYGAIISFFTRKQEVKTITNDEQE
ncbi:MAG: DUF4199 domain-containing protein [Rikenellaceae bacterium]